MRLDPAAACDPLAGLGLIDARFHFREQIFETCRAFEVECHLALADPGEMLVRVSETRQHRVAFQIDDTRVWSNQFLRSLVRADKDDTFGFDCDRLGTRSAVVSAVNVAVLEHDVGWFAALRLRYEEGQEKQTDC